MKNTSFSLVWEMKKAYKAPFTFLKVVVEK